MSPPLRTPPAVGERAPVLEHELTRADLVRYAGASGDYFPLHTDDDYARAAGHDGVFAHGMLSAGLLATALTNWLGVGGLRRYQVRFTDKAWPGETLSTRITVVAVRGAEVDFACEVINSQGDVKITGSGTGVPSGDNTGDDT